LERKLREKSGKMNQIITQNSTQLSEWWGGKKIERKRLTKCCNLLMRQVSLDNKFNFLYTSVYHDDERVSLKWRAEERRRLSLGGNLTGLSNSCNHQLCNKKGFFYSSVSSSSLILPVELMKSWKNLFFLFHISSLRIYRDEIGVRKKNAIDQRGNKLI
jgi:hypothetical protein